MSQLVDDVLMERMEVFVLDFVLGKQRDLLEEGALIDLSVVVVEHQKGGRRRKRRRRRR